MSPLDGNRFEPDPIRPADLATLHKILAKPITRDSVAQLESAVNITRLLGLFAFGMIRWPKGSPKLLTPKHADAFDITLTHTQTFLEYEPDGVHFITLIVPDFPPTKWDGPDDDAYFRVSFFATGLRRDIDYTVSVRFTPLAKWEHTVFAGGFHVIDPPARTFKLNDGAVIAPFDVKTELVRIPFDP